MPAVLLLSDGTHCRSAPPFAECRHACAHRHAWVHAWRVYTRACACKRCMRAWMHSGMRSQAGMPNPYLRSVLCTLMELRHRCIDPSVTLYLARHIYWSLATCTYCSLPQALGTPHFAMHPRSHASEDLKMRRRRRSETRGALPGARRDMCCSSVTTRRTTGASPVFCADVARRVPGADVGRCRRWLVSRCSLDIYPSDGTGCDGGPGTVNTCGSCGILYDVS